MKKLYCPVRRLENLGINFKISKDYLINVDYNVGIFSYKYWSLLECICLV